MFWTMAQRHSERWGWWALHGDLMGNSVLTAVHSAGQREVDARYSCLWACQCSKECPGTMLQALRK